MTLKTFSRSDDISVDETIVVHHFFRTRHPDKPGIMIDVGVHHGSACSPFLRDGWLVHGFEPDPKNHAFLKKRFPEVDKLVLNRSAVSDEDGKVLSFFASEQSTGISSLIPFHKGHKEVATVKTVRLDKYLAATDVTEVDFLKIDTEGFDLPVLRGFPWQRIRPAVVECEFEDAKTEKIGYNLHDQAQFLVNKGYRVFVSEWHPIVRYGTRHNWRSLSEYKNAQLSADAWGNFLAFREDISLAEVEDLFLTVLKRNNTDKNFVAPEQAAQPARSPAPVPARAKKIASSAMRPFSWIANHIGIFLGFVRTRAGITVSLVTGAALFLMGLFPQLLMVGTLPTWGHWFGYGAAWMLLTHVFGYVLERARFEREHDDTLERQLTNIYLQIAQLKQATNSLGSDPIDLGSISRRTEKIERDVERIRKQNMDIKRKLPEVIDMITGVSKDLAS